MTCKKIVEHLHLSNSSIEKWRNEFKASARPVQFNKVKISKENLNRTDLAYSL